MSDFLKPVNPGQTFNIGTQDHLTQVQHKGFRVDIVDHLDKGPNPVDVHIVTQIGPGGSIQTFIK